LPATIDRSRGGVADLEYVARLDDDVVHVDELEAREVAGHGDEVDGGALVELQQAGVVQVRLPPELPEPTLQHLVRGHHLAARHVDQHFARPAGAATAVARRVAIGAADYAVLEHPHTRHGFLFSLRELARSRCAGIVRVSEQSYIYTTAGMEALT
jgi:hypothetical protein